MTQESLIILSGIILIIILISGISSDENSDAVKRLFNIKNRVIPDVQSLKEKKAKDKFSKVKSLIQDTDYTIHILGTFLDKFNFVKQIKKTLKIADIKLNIDIFILLSIGPASLFMLLTLLIPQTRMLFMLIAIFCAVFPYIMLNIKIKNRLNLFSQQFPGTLDLMASALRAGHSLPSCIQMIVQEMPEPTNSVFRIVSDDVSLGIDMKDALDDMAQYIPGSMDLRFFVTAVLIQREIGGNLAEILDNLNYTIRERFKLLGQIKTQTSQAKLSGIILALAPLLIGGIIWILNPSYLDPLLKTQMGNIILATAFMMSIMGFVIINKITNIRV